MIRTILLFAVTLTAVNGVRAASPDPADLAIPPAELLKAKELVRQLASEDYNVREEANKSLAKMGRLARPVLMEAAATDPSAEVRSRAARLLPKAEAEELQARIDTFLADDALAFEHELPGWSEFRATTGAEWRLFGISLFKDVEIGKAARTVFAELLEATTNRSLLMGIGGDPSELGQALAARKWELYNNRLPRGPNPMVRNPTVPDVITLLFAESQVSSRFIPAGRVVSVSFLLNSAGINGAFSGDGEKVAVYRAVIAKWIETRDDSSSQYQAMSTATSLNLHGPGSRVACRLLRDKKGTPTYRGHAAVNLVRWKADWALPDLEKAMTDDSVVYAVRNAINQPPHDAILMKDVALVAAIFLTDQNPADYGFQSRTNYGSTTSMTSYMQWSIPGDSWGSFFIRRSLALGKWIEWRRENPENAAKSGQ